jgi:hypothetical protein
VASSASPRSRHRRRPGQRAARAESVRQRPAERAQHDDRARVGRQDHAAGDPALRQRQSGERDDGHVADVDERQPHPGPERRAHEQRRRGGVTTATASGASIPPGSSVASSGPSASPA